MKPPMPPEVSVHAARSIGLHGLARILIHEIRNPLHAAAFAASTLDDADPDVARSMGTIVQDSIQRAGTLLDRLSRLYTDPDTTPSSEPTALAPIVKDLSTMYQDAGLLEPAHWDTTDLTGVPAVSTPGDHVAFSIAQVLGYCVTAMRRASGPSPHLSIDANVDDTFVHLTFTSSGVEPYAPATPWADPSSPYNREFEFGVYAAGKLLENVGGHLSVDRLPSGERRTLVFPRFNEA